MSDNYTLADCLQRDAKFSLFAQAVSDAGLNDKLRETGPFTIFTPTNTAFAKLSPEIMTDLLKPENKAKFAEILSYHIIYGKVLTPEIIKLTSAQTVQGQELSIENRDGIKINGARLGARNFEASNGIIHSIDTLLTPAIIAQAA